MATHGTSPLSLLLLSLILLHGYSANPIAAQKGNHTATPHPTKHSRILFVTVPDGEDYIYETEEPEPNQSQRPDLTRHLDPKFCDYDPCREQQIPCNELSESLGCLCPGLSGPNMRPNAPQLKSVMQEGSVVVVRWCSPFSTVLEYRVTVQDSSITVSGEQARRTDLEHMEPGATVCVEAVNAAGSSEKSCRTYEAPEDAGLALKAGLIGGALCLLLLLSIIGILLWRRKTCRKTETDSEGVGNPSYSTEGTM